MINQIKSPFKFLDAYQHEDKQIFYGRNQETLELYDRIFETNLVLLYGASGTGKTSLINCGLSNEFESGDWFPIFIRRKNNVLESWMEELRRFAKKKLPAKSTINQAVQSIYLDYFKPVHLIFDQFEELFILGDKAEQKAFFDALETLIQANLRCKVIISMREEYIAHLHEYEYIIPELFDNRFRIEKMNRLQLKEVILKTTAAFDIDVEAPEDIAELIVAQLRDNAKQIDLATLQVYLDRLYRLDKDRIEKEKAKRKVRFDKTLIQQSGDLGNVMYAFLEEQLGILEQELKNKMKIEAKGIPMDILFTMVTDNGTKQAVALDEVKAQLKKTKNIEASVVDYCISRFKEMRILRELNEE